MSKFVKYFLVIIALFISIFILLFSLNISSQSKTLGFSNFKGRKFYVNKEILPDHSLYPLLMVVDRIRLAMADRERRIYLMMAYAQRRLFYAISLIEKEETALALTTLTKSQKYLNQALQEVKLLKEENVHDSACEQLLFFVMEGVDRHQETVKEHLDCFREDDRTVLNSLNEETTLLRDQLGR